MTYYAGCGKRNFTDALAFCEGFGGTLAILTDGLNLNLSAVRSCKKTWIGLTDYIGEGQFRWVNSHVLEWTNWCDDEPDDNPNEHCVAADCIEGCWRDYRCDKKHKFICQNKSGTDTL